MFSKTRWLRVDLEQNVFEKYSTRVVCQGQLGRIFFFRNHVGCVRILIELFSKTLRPGRPYQTMGVETSLPCGEAGAHTPRGIRPPTSCQGAGGRHPAGPPIKRTGAMHAQPSVPSKKFKKLKVVHGVVIIE